MASPGSPAESPELILERVEQADGTTCLTVAGDIDVTTGDYFRQTVMHLAKDPAARRIQLNVSDLAFIDSSGVTVLVKAHRAARERGAHLTITQVPDTVRSVLEMLGVYEVLSTSG